jgi:leucine dehydrogenase
MNTMEQMIERGHERVCLHHDRETGLRAIIAIHSTALGNALGGTRRWHYATESDALYDVLRLSEGMTYKAACAGLQMGGAKSVIMLPKPGHNSTEAEARAMGRFVDTFNGTYIAAEDVGVNTQYVDWMALETKHVMGGETISTGGDPSPFTAQGTVNAMKASLAAVGDSADFAGRRVAIQGVGSVGGKIAKILTDAGASVVCADINDANLAHTLTVCSVDVVPVKDILTTECDILAPCALGGVIDSNTARNLKCRIVCGAANNILDDPDEDAAMLQSMGILYAPDFVANAGGLIRLAGLYLGMTEAELDRKVADIEQTTAQIFELASTGTSTHAAAVALAGQRIAVGAKEQVHAG